MTDYRKFLESKRNMILFSLFSFFWKNSNKYHLYIGDPVVKTKDGKYHLCKFEENGVISFQ